MKNRRPLWRAVGGQLSKLEMHIFFDSVIVLIRIDSTNYIVHIGNIRLFFVVILYIIPKRFAKIAINWRLVKLY